jgi:hypothetical protein
MGFQRMFKHRLEADATSGLLPPLPIGRCNLAQKFKFIEAFACSFRDRAQRIFGNMDRQTSFLAQKFIETAQKRAATSQDQPAVDQISG